MWPFRDHLLVNVCGGDDRLFNGFRFFAHVVQRPRERLGLALVLRGRMGSDKTKVGEVFCRIFPRLYFLVDDARYVTGHSNAHMATCLLLAVWAADKAAAGRLKGLITSPIQQIEDKGIDPIRLPDYARLTMTSNEDWVVPAGMNERRFCVLDVDPRWSRTMSASQRSTRSSRTVVLNIFRLTCWRLISPIPRTQALLKQKIRSLESVQATGIGFHDAPQDAMAPRSAAVITVRRLHRIADKVGERRKLEETVFGRKLGRLVPNLGHTRRSGEVRQARQAFEDLLEQRVQWPSETGGSTGDCGLQEQPQLDG